MAAGGTIGGWDEKAAIFVFGVCFLIALAKGFPHALRRDFSSHREWMIRGYAMGLAGPPHVRLWGLFPPVAALRGHTPQAQRFFGTAFWIGFILTALSAELWIRYHETDSWKCSWRRDAGAGKKTQHRGHIRIALPQKTPVPGEAQAKASLLLVMVGELGRFFQLAAGLIEQLFGLFPVAAQLVPVGALRFIDLFKCLQDVVLRFGKIGMLAGVDIGLGALRERHSDERQANSEQDRQINTFLLHV
jgi:hypothetical protein